MASRHRRSLTPVLLLTIGLLIVVYGWEYYQELRTGQRPLALPVRIPTQEAPMLAAQTIGVLVGHENSDTGAICEDGLTEVDVTRLIGKALVLLLRDAGANVVLLTEYDPQLEGFQGDAMVAVHVDSCIDRTGFKVARWTDSPDPARDDLLVACLVQAYLARTGLPLDVTTVTANMTEYYAFRRIAPSTAAAIVETGYLGGDRTFLTEQPHISALGIAEGLICFFRMSVPATPAP